MSRHGIGARRRRSADINPRPDEAGSGLKRAGRPTQNHVSVRELSGNFGRRIDRHRGRCWRGGAAANTRRHAEQPSKIGGRIGDGWILIRGSKSIWSDPTVGRSRHR